MTYYNEISNLLEKYSTKQPSERWTPKTEKKKDRIIEYNNKLRLFDGINSEYFRLIGSQKERVKYLIKQLNFNEVCGRCSSEQIIVLICYYVKCEYDKYYTRKNCIKVFKDYEITDNLVDRFMLFLARYGINNTILDKKFLYNTQSIVRG